MSAAAPLRFRATIFQGRRGATVAGLVLFVVSFALAGSFLFAMPVLYDTDSYCHLALALAYQQHGLARELSAVRFSAMSDGFGDKDLLFHLLLTPVAHAGDSSGGRIALALFVAAIVTLLSLLARRAVGVWGLAVGPAILFLAQDVPDRLLRLRPELLGLLLLLLATAAASRRAYRLLGVVALLLVLSYNVSQLLALFVAGWVAIRWWRGGRFEWAGVVYPLAGIGLGLVLHPHFPKNLEIWYLVTFDQLGRVAEFPDGGADRLPAQASAIFRDNLGWWIAFVAAIAATRRPPAGSARTEEGAEIEAACEAGVWTVAALGFAALYFGVMGRFAVYFYSFATLALLFELRGRGLEIGARLPSVGLRQVPTWLALGLAASISAPSAFAMASHFLDERAPGPPREVEWRAFGAALPPGAKVAAPWGQTGVYLFFAPEARFLNVLDPLFMADSHPREYTAQRALFDGELPDLAFVVGQWLDSDYLAFSRFAANPRFQARAAADPRLERVYSSYNVLYRVVANANRAFWLDWSYRVEGSSEAVASDAPLALYPRAVGRGSGLEGFVDANRIGANGRCVRFERRFELASPARLNLEFAPYGPGTLAFDGAPLIDLRAATGAVLGQGARVALELDAGSHLAEVATCAATPGGPHGFFLRELPVD